MNTNQCVTYEEIMRTPLMKFIHFQNYSIYCLINAYLIIFRCVRTPCPNMGSQRRRGQREKMGRRKIDNIDDE